MDKKKKRSKEEMRMIAHRELTYQSWGTDNQKVGKRQIGKRRVSLESQSYKIPWSQNCHSAGQERGKHIKSVEKVQDRLPGVGGCGSREKGGGQQGGGKRSG